MTTPKQGPTSSSGVPAGIRTGLCGAARVLRGLMKSTGAAGGAPYGARFTAPPSAATADRWFNRAPYTVPLKAYGGMSNGMETQPAPIRICPPSMELYLAVFTNILVIY